ncbi:MAG: CPBP family intramembrane metalloprotease [Pirellulales bacterium]|nr:CPBP family intramembrane metalloprotease [Pirellulales bacterium]
MQHPPIAKYVEPASSGHGPRGAEPALGKWFLIWVGVVIGAVFPTVVTLLYFVLAAEFNATVQQSVYGFFKSLQFLFPIFWASIVLRQRLVFGQPKMGGILAGFVFGLLVAAAMLVLYYSWCQSTDLFQGVAVSVIAKLTGVGIDSIAKYVVLALFYSVVHSLLEEYYFRWFVFGQLRQVVPGRLAMILSAVAFAAHHVIVLAFYFGWESWATWVFAFAITIGGVIWAWLYDQAQSIYAPWCSHFLVDVGIFWIGYELIRSGLTG